MENQKSKRWNNKQIIIALLSRENVLVYESIQKITRNRSYCQDSHTDWAPCGLNEEEYKKTLPFCLLRTNWAKVQQKNHCGDLVHIFLIAAQRYIEILKVKRRKKSESTWKSHPQTVVSHTPSATNHNENGYAKMDTIFRFVWINFIQSFNM